MSSSKVHVTEDRLLEILNAYGADPARWPEEEREALEKCLELNGALSQEIKMHRRVDRFIAREYQQALGAITNSAKVSAAVINSVQSTQMQKQQSDMSGTYSFALAASVLMVIAAMMVYSPNPREDGSQSNPLSSPAFEQWAWNDITGEFPAQEREFEQVTMMELIELEVGDADGI